MSGAEQQGQGNNAGTDLAWMIAGLFAAILAIWFSFKPQILSLLMTLKYYELWLVSLFSEQAGTTMTWLATHRNTPLTIDNGDLMSVLRYVGDFYKYPQAVLFFALAYYFYVRHPSGHFKKTHSMQTLREQEQRCWPQITPVVELDLINEDVSKGPWAMAASPMEFAVNNDLLIPPKRDPRQPNKDLTATVDEQRSERYFKQQMGEKFRGPDFLPLYMKALAGIFMARIFEEREKPAKLLEQMSRSSKNPKEINFSGAQQLFDTYKNEKLSQRIMGNHAYIYTVMASLLEISRKDGVLATADFLWLKPLDRQLWYMLNNVGRQTAFSEIAGPFAHWLAEKAVGRALNTPMVEQATVGLKIAIEAMVYTGDKEDWEL